MGSQAWLVHTCMLQAVSCHLPAATCGLVPSWQNRRVGGRLVESETIRTDEASEAATLRRSPGKVGEPCSTTMSSAPPAP